MTDTRDPVAPANGAPLDEPSRGASRRDVLAGVGLLGAGALLGSTPFSSPASAQADAGGSRKLVKPPRLRAGDRIGLVNPATAAFETMPIEVLQESLEALGLEVVLGKNYYNKRGYFAGRDQERADDINAFFADRSIKALLARGGWGSARVLPHLDFDTIARNPKVLIGYSDVTALLLGIHTKTGLVTFHGPQPRYKLSAEMMREVLFDAGTPTYANPSEIRADQTVQTEDRIQTLRPGKARGPILGGNLTVLTSIIGSGYLPDWRDCILFLEDVHEAIYRVDRMLTQLELAGVLSQIKGFVFGRCTECESDDTYGSLTLEEVLRDHFEPLGIPFWHGALIGHIPEQFTIPLGVQVEIDADAGTIQLLEPGVA